MIQIFLIKILKLFYVIDTTKDTVDTCANTVYYIGNQAPSALDIDIMKLISPYVLVMCY